MDNHLKSLFPGHPKGLFPVGVPVKILITSDDIITKIDLIVFFGFLRMMLISCEKLILTQKSGMYV